jgi:hypothetical protein
MTTPKQEKRREEKRREEKRKGDKKDRIRKNKECDFLDQRGKEVKGIM